jgi:hypothetical protein
MHNFKCLLILMGEAGTPGEDLETRGLDRPAMQWAGFQLTIEGPDLSVRSRNSKPWAVAWGFLFLARTWEMNWEKLKKGLRLTS